VREEGRRGFAGHSQDARLCRRHFHDEQAHQSNQQAGTNPGGYIRAGGVAQTIEKSFHSQLHKHCRRRGNTRPAASFAAITTSTYPRSARAVRSRVVLRSLSGMLLAEDELRGARVSVEVL
jgi:hypothetical protein